MWNQTFSMGNLERINAEMIKYWVYFGEENIDKSMFLFLFFDDLVDWKPITTTKISNKVRLQMFCFSFEKEIDKLKTKSQIQDLMHFQIYARNLVCTMFVIMNLWCSAQCLIHQHKLTILESFSLVSMEYRSSFDWILPYLSIMANSCDICLPTSKVNCTSFIEMLSPMTF